jgi:FkbM family methyltransferase
VTHWDEWKVEQIRSFIRKLIGSRSLPYRLGSQLITFSTALVKGGPSGFGVALMAHGSGAGRWIGIRGLRYPIFIRPGTEDVRSILDNVFRKEYGQFGLSLRPKLIIDAGAYIGDTSAYFMSRFSQAKVIALEPNIESFALAERNLKSYGAQVELLNVALCKEDGHVRISGSTTGARLGHRGSKVRAVSMASLLKQFDIHEVDILKMDIEGSEQEVLLDASAWLHKVKLLLLETHGIQIEEAVIPVVKRCGFSVRRMRNVWYCQNLASLDQDT